MNRTTLLALGLGSLLALGSASPVFAAKGLGGGYQRAAVLEQPVALRTDHRHKQRHHKRRHWKQHRRPYRAEKRHWRKHHRPYRDYRSHSHHRHFNGNEFAGGLLFGGILGYVIGNDY